MTTPKRLAEVREILNGPVDEDGHLLMIDELYHELVAERERYAKLVEVINRISKERDGAVADYRDCEFENEMVSRELKAKEIHDALGEGEYCDICTHLANDRVWTQIDNLRKLSIELMNANRPLKQEIGKRIHAYLNEL